ncbi:MAG TPA: hypothetical protein VD886_18515 [Herpetosiphonaceae bacterium]|nr:hypothetical protein [Herpetosiphonaceae bacterium]
MALPTHALQPASRTLPGVDDVVTPRDHAPQTAQPPQLRSAPFSAHELLAVQRSLGNQAAIALLAHQSAHTPAAAPIQRWAITETVDTATAEAMLPVTTATVDRDLAAENTENVDLTSVSAAEKTALEPLLTTGITTFIAWSKLGSGGGPRKKAAKRTANTAKNEAAQAVTTAMAAIIDKITFPQRKAAALAAFKSDDRAGRAAHHRLPGMLKNGFIRRGTVLDTYKSSFDAGLGQYSISMSVDGFPGLVIHVHILSNGRPAPGNGAHWMWDTEQGTPKAGRQMTSAQVEALVDLAAGKAHRDANPAINQR